MRRVSLKFVWYDIWVGVFIDTPNRKIYFCPFPMIVILIRYGKRCSQCGKLKDLRKGLCLGCYWAKEYENADQVHGKGLYPPPRVTGPGGDDEYREVT